MSNLIIRKLYEDRLQPLADAEGLPVEHENEGFTPPPAGMYLRIVVLPARTVSPDLQGVITTYTGIVQIDIMAISNEGAAEAGRIAELLRAQFPTNLLLTEDDFTVQQLTPLSVATGIPGDRYQVPTSFRYWATTS